MRFKQIPNENKRNYLDLLLIGDEQESMINRYLDQGTLHILADEQGQALGVAVVVGLDQETCELKNLAVAPSHQGQGLGTALLQFVTALYAERYQYLVLGTGEVPKVLRFYQRLGFVESHRVANFFTDNYDHVMIEDGVQLVDMVYLRKPLQGGHSGVVMLAPMTAADWPEVAAIYQLGIDTQIAAFRPEIPSWPEFVGGHLQHSRLVAKSNGQVVGWAALSPASDKDYYRGVTEISIYIAPWAKGRGIGKRLLKAAIAEAEAYGVWTIEAKIMVENEASLALHQHCGFTVVGRRTKMGCMASSGQWHDVYILEYRSQINGWD